MFARIGGEAQNYDGETDITANTTGSYERGVVVVGRANAWTERDFSEDITDGAGFMSNVARQISNYWGGSGSSDTVVHFERYFPYVWGGEPRICQRTHIGHHRG